MTWRSSSDFSKETSPLWRFVRGLVRRVEVTFARTGIWQVRGQRAGASGGGVDETFDADLFPGVGFFARPSGSAATEAVTVAAGGTGATMIVATRDEATRAKWDAQVPAGTTATFNEVVGMVVKPDGTVAVKLLNGTEIALALKLDLDILRSALTSATIAAGAGGAAAVVAACDAQVPGAVAALTPPRATTPWPIGTAVLKAQ